MIHIACGQCGNQLGEEILNQLAGYAKDMLPSDSSFHEHQQHLMANYVGIDTEPKVIHSLLSRNKRANYRLDDQSMVYEHGGAGNNWALGYAMLSGRFLDAAINAVRHQLEICDQPSIFLNIHSIGGGTGSGLGSKCIEVLSDEFPDMLQMNLVIAPYHFGEVVVQYYNTLLCLSHLSEFSNAIIVYENETVYNLCKHMCGNEKPILQDINQTIARSLIPTFLSKASSQHASMNSLYDDAIHLCSHPHYRFCTIYNAPFTSESSIEYTHDSWQTLAKTIYTYAISLR